MAWETFDVWVGDGKRLGASKEHDGAFRALFFSSEDPGIVGQASLYPHQPGRNDLGGDPPRGSSSGSPDPDGGADSQLSPQDLVDLLGALVGLAALVIAVQPIVAPHAIGWWNGRALPAVRNARHRVATMVRTAAGRVPLLRRIQEANSEGSIRYQGNVSDSRLQLTLQDFRADPTSETARKEAVSAIVGRTFSGNRLEALQSLEIETHGDLLAAGASRDLLTPEKLGRSLDLLLAKNPSLIEAEPLERIGQMLGGVQSSGQLSPLRIGPAIERRR